MEFASQVEDLTELIKNAQSLLNAVGTISPLGWVIFMAFLFWLFMNKNAIHLFDLIKQKGDRRLKQLDSYLLTPDFCDKNTANAILDIRNALYFKSATGIYAESRTRDAYIRLHEATSHLITWKHIRRAQLYLEVDANGKTTVKEMDLLDRISYRYNQFLGYIILAISIFLIGLAILPGSRTLTSFLFDFGSGVAAALFSAFIFSQNWPAYAAKKISKEIKAQHNSGPNLITNDPDTSCA
jgi:hypothetical protein